MKRIEKICGYVLMDESGKIVGYEAADSGEGMMFKDNNEGDNVVYIPEHAEWDNEWRLPATEDFYDDAYTFEALVNVVLEVFDFYNLTWEQAEYLAEIMFDNLCWMYPETYLDDLDIEEIIILNENGLFTEQQRKDCMEYMAARY